MIRTHTSLRSWLGTFIHSYSWLGVVAVLLAASPTAGLAQAPVVNANGVVDGASYGHTLVAGSAASIYGTNLANGTTGFGGVQPIPTSLGGTTVTVTSGSNNYSAPIYFVSAGQVNIQMPWELAGQTSASLTVTTANGASNSVSFNLAQYAPALYSLASSGTGPGLIANSNGSVNCPGNVGNGCTAANPANPGSIVVIGAANLGATQFQQTDGQAPNGNLVPISNTVTVTIGGQNAPVVVAENCGGAPFCALPNAAYLIYVRVPGIASNTAAPVVVTEGAANNTAQGITMNVASEALTTNTGNPCGFGDFQLGPINIQLQASGGTGTGYQWSVANGSLPTGLGTRNDGGPNYFPPGITTGIEGVATAAGTYTFTLQVADSANNTAQSQQCTIKILGLAITDPNQLKDGLAGSAYSYPMTASGATGAVQWSLGNNAPSWLSINSSTGALSGTPPQGNYGFSVNATDSTGTTSRFFNINVYGVGFSGSADLGTFNQGSTVNINLAGAGGTAPYTFNGCCLPQGLTLGQNGAITGTVEGGDGTFRFNVNVNDNAGHGFNKQFAITVIGNGVPPPNINVPNPVEDATVGESRNYPLNVNGGIPPYTWSISPNIGSLPTGMRLLTSNIPANFNLGPDDAVITGVPTAAPPGGVTVKEYDFTVIVTDSSSPKITVSVPMAIKVSILGLNYPNGNAIIGSPYSGYIQPIGGTTNGAPQGAVNWSILSGSLPPGLSPPTSSTTGVGNGSGTVTGTPTGSGNYSVFMNINCCAGLDNLNRFIGFNVSSAGPNDITFNNLPTLPDGSVNNNYNSNLNACCAPNGVHFQAVGQLPSGLSLNGNQITGTPQAAGQYLVEFKAIDNNNPNNFGIGIFNLNITKLQVNFPPSNATLGANYGQSFGVSGGTGPYTWTTTSGSQLPPGVSFSSAGAFSGTPTSAGSFQVNFTVTDNANPHNVFNGGININVYANANAAPPTMNFGNNFGTWTVGTIEFALNASGGNGTYAWSIINGSLPTGVTIRTDPPFPNYFNGAVAGLSGVATVPGVYNFTLAVTSNGQTSYQYCTWKISALTVMDGGNLPPAFVNVPYKYTFTALNYQNSPTWTLNNGQTLPAGLTFVDGVLSGTPAQAGNFNNIQYTMSDGIDPAYRSFNLSVYDVRFNNTGGQNGFFNTGLPNYTTGILNSVMTNTAVNATFNAAGGSGGYTYFANGLPCCLSLSSGGVLSGTLNGVGNFGMRVTVTDSSSNSYTQDFSIDAIGDPPLLPEINLGPLSEDPISYVGGFMSWIVSVNNGGVAPFTWSITGLPHGVSYRTYDQSAQTYMIPGQIEIWGVATAEGSYPVTYTVKDANGLTATVTSTLTISPISVDSNYPPNGTVNQSYSSALRVVGGAGPYSISQVGTQLKPLYNPLPDGLTLNAANFTISGTPLESGNFNPIFKVQDSQGHSFVMLPGFNISSGNPQININNYFYLGTAFVGQNYGNQLNSCCAPTGQYTYTVVGGSLPQGINLSLGGALSGSAQTPGTYTFLVKSADTNNPGNAGYKQMVITVSALNLTSNTNLPFGNVDTFYNQQIQTSVNNATFQLGNQGPLPPGINLSGSGQLSGTPKQPGQFPFNVLITDAGGDVFVGYLNLSIYPAGTGPAVEINTGANLGAVAIGMVQIPLVAVGGTGSYTWTMTGGSLPPGLSLRTDLPGFFPGNASIGIIGVATAASTTPYSFTLKVTSGSQSVTQTFTLKVTGLTLMENTGFRLPDAFIGVDYQAYTLTPLNNGARTVSFQNPTQVPPGMALSGSGVLSGKPTAGGYYNIGFTITDGVDSVGMGISLSVNTVQVTSPAVLPSATQNEAYTFTPTASGGTPPYTFNVNGYPNGLAFNNGVLSGTVNSGPGRYFVNVTVTDSNHVSYNKVTALVVIGVPPTLPWIVPYGNLDDCTYGVTCGRGLQGVSGGVPPFSWTVTGLPMGMQSRTASTALSSNYAATDVELWGTPLETGTFNVKAVLTDSSSLSSTETFQLQVSTLYADGSYNLVNGTLGAPYSRTLRVLGGTPAAASPLYTAQVSQLQLPEGLSLNGMTVSGTPQENGNFSPDFTFTDSAGTPNTLHYTWGFNIADSGTSTINLSTYSFADSGGSTDDVIGVYPQGSTINFGIGVCCAQSYTFTQNGGSLPPGVSLSQSGVLSGTISATATVGPYTFSVQAADANNSSNTGQRQYTIFVSSFNVTGSTNLPYGMLGTVYPTVQNPGVQLQGSNSVNATFAVRPGYYMPPGLSLSPSGLISGTPTATGQYNFFIVATNPANSSDSFMANFNLSVWTVAPPLFLGTGPTLGPLTPGSQTFQLTASGGVPPYHYSVTPNSTLPQNFRVQDGGQLPTGFQLSQGTGGLIGVVDTTGSFQTSLRVTDSAVPTPNVFDRPITMNFTDLTTTIGNNPPAAYVGVAYTYAYAGTGGTAPYAFTITNLPAGLSATGATISGTPSASGSFNFTVNVKDTTGTSVNVGYNLTVYPFNITTGQVLPQATNGQSYSQQMSAPGCSGCTWSVVNGGFPNGLSLNSSTGLISGTPNVFGVYAFVVQAKSSGGATAQKAYSLYLKSSAPQPLYIITNPNLYTTVYGNAYSTTFFAQGGTPPYTFSISAGTLPTGMSLMSPGETLGFEYNPGFTYLIGRPLQLGPANFTLQVTDGAHNTATQAFTWAISPMSINTGNLPANGNSTSYAGTPNPMQVPTYGVAYSQQIEVIGGTGTYTSWARPLATNPLPPGLSIDDTTGVVTGTPGGTGSYSTLFQATDTGGNTLEQFVNFNISASSPSTVNIGAGPLLGPYQSGGAATVNLNPSGGTGPYIFTVLDTLPPDCALESGNELLSNANGNYDLTCAQTGIGAYTFTLKVTDSAGNYGVKVMTITFAPQTLNTGTTLANGSAGTGYSQQLLIWDNTGTVSWSVAPGSALPTGMTLNGATIGGTPSTAGNYSFTLNSTDSATGDIIPYTFNFTVSTITITNPSIIPAHAPYLAAYSYQFNATGGGATKTWSASNLPSGLSISSTTGLLSGTAQSWGYYNVLVTVTDGSSTLNRNFTLFVDPPQLLTIFPNSTSLPDARVNQAYTFGLNPSGGIGPYTWSVAQGSTLPPGLNLHSGSELSLTTRPGSTLLAGAPTTANQYTFNLVVTDSAQPAHTVLATYTLNVTPMVITGGGLPNGTINVGYSRQLTAVGGTPPYTFSYSGPNGGTIYTQILPPGIDIDSSGSISGTPTSTGAYSFKVTVADSGSHTYTTTYSLTVTNSFFPFPGASGLYVTGSGGTYGLTAGQGVSTDLATSGNSTYTWTVQAGTIPTGLAFTPDGIVTGVFSAPGTYNFTVRATDNNNSSNFADRQLSIVVQPMSLNYLAAGPPAGTVGSMYSYQLSITGGTPPYTFATTPIQPLPPGLSLDTHTGVISGTPTQGGSFTIYALVTDHAGNTGLVTDSGFNMLNPGQNPPLVSFPIHTHNSSLGVPFADSSASYAYPLDGSFTLFGVPPITYSVAPGSNLPPGMELLQGTNGVEAYLGGIPNSPGKYNYSLIATDSKNQTATVPMYTVVSPLGALPSSLPNGVVGAAYSATISAFGGAPPYTYSIGPTTDGNGNPSYSGMPPGLSVSPQGVISGTPTLSGTFDIVVGTQDSATPANVLLLNYVVVIDSGGTAQGIGLSPATPIELNYVLTSPAPATVPIDVTTTYTTPMPFTAMVNGIPGASLSATSGSAPATLNLSLDTTGLAAGTYAGVVAVSAPTAVNGGAAIPVVLTVTAPPPCVYTLIPTGTSIPAAGGSGSFTVSTGLLCAWTATTADNFVSITPASASGMGTGTVQYSLTGNVGLNSRTGSILVNGQTYTVTQFGSTCALALTPPSVTATSAGGLATVNVTTTNAACGWTSSGLSASPNSGTGSGTVTFTIPATTNINTQTLTGTVKLNGGASSTFTVTQTGASCTVGLSAPGAEIGYSGGSGQVTVTTPNGCGYTTVSGPTWISVTSGGSGTGPGTLTYSVLNNSSTTTRSATLTIGGVPYTISQDPAPCSVTVDPIQSGSPFDSGGGGGILAITANGSNCSWTASSPVDWITVAVPGGGSGASVNGSGSQNVTITAKSNAASTSSRSTTVTVGNVSEALTQGGTQCSYVLGSTTSSIPYGGGSGSVSVTAPGACSWSSSTDASASWLTISSSGSGGTSNVVFSAVPNNTSTARTGTLTIAGQPFAVTEGAGPCSYILNNTSTTLSSAGGSGLFTFSTGTSGCPNQPISFASWLKLGTVTTSPDGTSGTVNFSADLNPSGRTRTGTIQFGGQSYTVLETGAACAYSLNSYGLALGQQGVALSDIYGSPSAQGCTPDVGTDQPTIVTLQSLGPLTDGIFTLPFAVMPYSSTVTGIRTMIITFGGQIFAIKQTSW